MPTELGNPEQARACRTGSRLELLTKDASRSSAAEVLRAG
jgi:hypothetical protein